MKKSIWQASRKNYKFDSVNKNIETEILIIGAGITGVTTCYNLMGNKKIVLLDAFKLADSTTAKSTGKLTYQQELIYSKIEKEYDFETAKLYYESQIDAIKMVKNIVQKENIDCDLEENIGMCFSDDESQKEAFEQEKNILKRLNISYKEDSSHKCSIIVKNTYVFNPVKYTLGLVEIIRKNNNVDIYENSTITKIKKEEDHYILFCNGHEIKSRFIVLACHYPFFTIPFLAPFKTYMEKSYMCAGKVDKKENINAITNTYPVISYRYYKDNLIYLNNSSKICNKLNYEKNYSECKKEYKKITGNNPEYIWTNMDMMTHDSLPIIGRISKEDNNVYIATGYNTWGLTNGTLAGKILADLINNKKNKYSNLFEPGRKITYGKVKSFVNNTLLSNIKAYGICLIKKNPYWYKDFVYIIKQDGKRIGVYIDKDGNKHETLNICPHLKCFLTFNKVDRTWDCPCHGSRFDIDGNVVKGPSTYNIKKSNENH